MDTLNRSSKGSLSLLKYRTNDMLNRHYYRCRSCCHVVAVEGKLERETFCACNGKLEHLGRVTRAHRGLVLDSERCACDGRCTNAPGPSCDCRCGGANHGTGRVVAVEVDAGGVPRLRVEGVDECRARAAEYDSAMTPHRERLRRIRQERVSNYPWRRPCPAEDSLANALGRIGAMRTHKGRMRAIADLAP